MAGDRRKSIGMTNGLDTRNPTLPIENLLVNPNILFQIKILLIISDLVATSYFISHVWFQCQQ